MPQVSSQFDPVFGVLADGRTAHLFEVRSKGGARIGVTDVGASLVSLSVPDAEGVLADVVLGYDVAETYRTNEGFLGATVGRYANRIADARFSLEGRDYALDPIWGPNHLHGGLEGFRTRVWRAECVRSAEGEGVRFALHSPDGDQGYPGAMSVTVTYILTADNAVIIDYEARAAAATIVNLTNHSYFNLAGHDSGDVSDHLLAVAADFFVPVDETLIPTGEIRAVAGTPFDFRAEKPIGRDIGAADPQLDRGRGYDHCWVVRRGPFAGDVVPIATLRDPKSGRRMTVLTDQPGVQIYTANALAGGPRGKGGVIYANRSAVALETQHLPDSPNQPHFPRTTLRAGETFRSRTIYAFDVAR